MRSGVFLCALFLAGFAAGDLYSAPKVSMSAKLQKTLAGRIVQHRLEIYVGKTVDFSVRHQGTNYNYSGKIEQIVVPDIADYLSTGDQGKARFKAKLSDVQPKESLGGDVPLPEIVELQHVQLWSYKPPFAGHVQYISAGELVGSNYQKARLIAKYQDDSGEAFWEALIELEDTPEGSSAVREVEPFIVMLNDKEHFTDFIPFPVH